MAHEQSHDQFIVSRRELLLLIGAGVLSSRRLVAQEQTPQFAALDHFEFYVSDGEKARDFYTKIFGNTLSMRGAKRCLKLGSSYMAFEPPRGNAVAGQVDHVSAAIKSLDMNKLHELLQQRGVMYQDYPSGRDTGVLDPDGARLQLSPENGWSLLNPATFLPEAVTLSEEPVFRVRSLDHVLFNVRDLEKSVSHYQKIFGAPTLSATSEVWFTAGSSRLGITALSAQRPGVQHISMVVERYDAAVANRRLGQLGARLEARVKDVIRFRDPDDLLIQIDDKRA